ncbi:MAG: cell division protein SepF [Clostridia bacterium]|nr:cell division protein SepF [Clostridia bacterium]
MENNLFNRMKSAAINMLKPAESRAENDEYDDDYDDYEDDKPETAEKKPTYKSNVKPTVKSTGSYGGYIDDFDEPDYKPSPSFKNTVPPKTEYKAPASQPKAYTEAPKETAKQANVFQMKKNTNVVSTQKFKFSIIKFEKIENAVIAADQMLSGNTVTLIDLHDIPENTAKRVIDFLDGVRYTCNARIESIADLTYVILPETVELTGDFSSQVDTNGLNL